MKVIIFDNDGVLTNAPEMFSTKIIRERNLDANKVNTFFKEIFVPKCMNGTADLKIELAKVLPEWGIADSVESIMQYWFESENCVDEQVKLKILDLKSKGITCFLATNQDTYRTGYMQKEMGFGTLFSEIFSSASIGYKKPKAEFYEAMLSSKAFEGVDRQNILYIDDDEKNIETAKTFGCITVLYKNITDVQKVCEQYGLE